MTDLVHRERLSPPRLAAARPAAIHAPVLQREQERAISRIAADGNRRVLDWGCGRGQMTQRLDMVAIRTAAEKHGLLAIEDAAHALGSELGGSPCGSIGDAGCFSFFPNKNLTTGEGGMTVFRDEQAAQKARLLRSDGMTALTWDRHRGHATGYDVVEFGFNYRLDEPRAALGLVQLARLDELNAARARLALRYRANLAESSIVVPTMGGRGTSANHLVVALAPTPEEREGARERLRDQRIQTSVHYPPIHRFSRYNAGESLPVAEEIADRVLSLPLHPRLSDADVDEVCGALVDT
jgi:dTDP-4-amino-4,6-dideoxygalactose transaminase